MAENEERMTRMMRQMARLGEENNERVTKLLEEQETHTALLVAKHQEEERATRKGAELEARDTAPPAAAPAPPDSDSEFDCPVSLSP